MCLHILGCYNPFYLNAGIPLEARGVPIRRHDGAAMLAGSRTTPYDEIGGRMWAEKVPQVERDFVALLEVVKDIGICPRDLPEHDLFALARLDPTGTTALAFVRFVAREHGTR
jgi:hypothetical protein